MSRYPTCLRRPGVIGIIPFEQCSRSLSLLRGVALAISSWLGQDEPAAQVSLGRRRIERRLFVALAGTITPDPLRGGHGAIEEARARHRFRYIGRSQFRGTENLGPPTGPVANRRRDLHPPTGRNGIHDALFIQQDPCQQRNWEVRQQLVPSC
jgi:hypothetical protein